MISVIPNILIDKQKFGVENGARIVPAFAGC